LYETITGQTFQSPEPGRGIMERICDSLDLPAN